jgi:hypothetical protein
VSLCVFVRRFIPSFAASAKFHNLTWRPIRRARRLCQMKIISDPCSTLISFTYSNRGPGSSPEALLPVLWTRARET